MRILETGMFPAGDTRGHLKPHLSYPNHPALPPLPALPVTRAAFGVFCSVSEPSALSPAPRRGPATGGRGGKACSEDPRATPLCGHRVPLCTASHSKLSSCAERSGDSAVPPPAPPGVQRCGRPPPTPAPLCPSRSFLFVLPEDSRSRTMGLRLSQATRQRPEKFSEPGERPDGAESCRAAMCAALQGATPEPSAGS